MIPFASKIPRSVYISIGDSMEPLIKQGYALHIRYGHVSCKIGDIVLFIKNNRLVAHRVIGRKRYKTHFLLLTKGDNSSTIDGWILCSAVLGQVVKISSNAYTIDLTTRKQQFVSHLFVLYSHTILRIPMGRKLVFIGRFNFIKKMYYAFFF